MEQSFSVAIIGAGALGSAIGGTLAAHGARVALVTRNPQHRDAVNSRGLLLAAPDGSATPVPVSAYANCSAIGETFDVAIVLTHSAGTEQAALDAASILRPDSTVFSLQNGLGQEDVLSEILGRGRIIGGKTYVGGLMLAPGKVQATVQGKRTLIGELNGQPSERAAQIARLMSDHGVPTEMPADIRSAIWDKLLINAATGALSTITRMPYGELYAQPEIERTACAAVAEAMAVARSEGIALTISEPMEAWRMASAGLPDNFRTSMLSTILKGGRSEIDFINGAIVARGQRNGVPTPVNAALVACIKGIEASGIFASIDGRTHA
ncbi:ketopantoate reductase family protein [Novosphingobium terrae]|uniref:ketopantoate reductase family protein n=1 Tax=Novosphingobium terrae TaxID=2726189 RepID=UPI001981E08D|nr:ketopantoate reductase family protein [Novosphingobium terrae]